MRTGLRVMAAVAALAGGAMAWQSSLERLGLTQAKLKDLAENSLKYESMNVPYFGQTAVAALRGMDAAGRTQMVKELGPVVKALVMSPEFQKSYDAYLAKNGAVNHGVAVKNMQQMMATPEAAEEANRQAMQQAAASMAASLRQLPAAALKPMFDEDLQSWKQQAAHRGSEQAKYQKLAARAAQLAPLVQSDPKAFQNGYALLKSIEMGGPDTDAGVNASASDMTKQAEQQRYNEKQLKVVLKKKLAAFVAAVKSVDYAAATNTVGSRRRFANPAYERKDNTWKALYRLGQAPAQAAAQFAEQWMREL